ncbi:imidazoleglycerol-phosphate dehydratase [Marinicella sp. W31]|uniref:imidazoleglycerol-phosphate dehydratase n=1 Tax=Marinicella sp. W31 TaxID=3023713 RepID=UPI003757D4E7
MITIKRETKETRISCGLDIRPADATVIANTINTGLPFFDHMLEQLAAHAGWQLQIEMQADLEVDDHHGIEDVAICLGQALYDSWKKHSPNQRYGQRLLPMDEALTLCAVDLCGRPYAVIDLPFSQPMLGGIHTEMWEHFFYTLAINARMCLHIRNEYFRNNHHLVESAFKALAHALQEALQPRTAEKTTKGVL